MLLVLLLQFMQIQLVILSNANEHEDFPLLIDELPLINETLNACDERSSDNWFIYCSGRILEAVNFHQLYNDSKTFVDMPMRNDPIIVLEEFNKRFSNIDLMEINRDDLQEFIDKYFMTPGSELISCIPEDWTPYPQRLMEITDPLLREWALELNAMWKNLCKMVMPEVKTHQSRYTLIYVPYPFMIPGGRFREFYYWDAYWIIKGLLASDMRVSTKAMILNFAYIVKKYGFIPNGGRIYYLKRSQPPLLTAMVYEYYEITQDNEFIAELLPVLEMEFNFWHTRRTVNVTMKNRNRYTVYQYRAESNVPRPESYREDLLTAQNVVNKTKLWQDIASAAESGWDFSSRWLADKKSLSQIETTQILPVDLNAFMCWNMDILEYLFLRVGDYVNSVKYREVRAIFRNAMYNVFYNRTMGAWFDYNIRSRRHSTRFYPSISVPLFTGCYHMLNQRKSARLFKLMKNMGAFSYPSGVPTSLEVDSKEQWDFPNGFSPLNHMVIEGLRKSENAEMQYQAYHLAKKWILGNYEVYRKTKRMWEKFNVIGDEQKPGSGGEYEVQDGFGWTNGVVLDLLSIYRTRLRLSRSNVNGTNLLASTMPTNLNFKFHQISKSATSRCKIHANLPILLCFVSWFISLALCNLLS